jgi:hypothetical protein
MKDKEGQVFTARVQNLRTPTTRYGALLYCTRESYLPLPSTQVASINYDTRFWISYAKITNHHTRHAKTREVESNQ